MGLDMYMYLDNIEENEILYWRKVPALHGWFEKLATDKGIKFESFNGIPVKVNKEDVYKLRTDLINDNLDMSVTGFFFGSDNNMSLDEYEKWKKNRLQECEIMLDSLENQDYIIYNSWW